jgi:hypothetical protein
MNYLLHAEPRRSGGIRTRDLYVPNVARSPSCATLRSVVQVSSQLTCPLKAPDLQRWLAAGHWMPPVATALHGTRYMWTSLDLNQQHSGVSHRLFQLAYRS